MSSPFDGMAVNQMSVYSYETDSYGQKTYSFKGVVSCEYEQGGEVQDDDDGVKFSPMSTFYPVESYITIKRGDFVVLGDTSLDGNPVPIGGETVKKVYRAGNAYFGWGTETVVYTG